MPIRCAIYTRKSSEEGLEQQFNSLHAQREACEAYVLSQAGEGWVALPEVYDDGGFSGGTMERPALQRLMKAVAAKQVDVVVVYKIDRLTRSLTDFAKIADVLDGSGASFVSVTQAFNTTTSMGRLMLNVLLSFAQFEREVTGERIRDKIAASKAKGMWMGGVLPLGYDRSGTTLVINEAEAVTVRHVFNRYLELGSVRTLRDELEGDGVRSKLWTSQTGKVIGGAILARGALFHILKSRLYVGEIVHKGVAHRGQHPAIIDEALFEAVQSRLAARAVQRSASGVRAAKGLLAARLFNASGELMSPSFAYGKSGRLYRYYIAVSLQRGEPCATQPGLIRRVPADRTEQFILQALRRLKADPSLAITSVPPILRRAELRAEETHLVVATSEFLQGERADLGLRELKARLGAGEEAAWETDDRDAIRIILPLRLCLRGGRTWFEGETVKPESKHNIGLVRALRAAHADLLALNASPLTAAPDASSALAPPTQHRRQLSRLAFLAPDLQREIMLGDQPKRLKARLLLKTELPLAWVDQRSWFDQLR